MLEPFSVDFVHSNGESVVRFAGELDLGQAEKAERAAIEGLARSESGPLILDLSGLRFCDSSGIRALLRIDAEAKQGGRSIVLRAPDPQLQRVLDLVGLSGHFTIQDDGPEVR